MQPLLQRPRSRSRATLRGCLTVVLTCAAIVSVAGPASADPAPLAEYPAPAVSSEETGHSSEAVPGTPIQQPTGDASQTAAFEAGDPATSATLTKMDFPFRGERTRYLLGESAPVGATVSAAPVEQPENGPSDLGAPQGTVEFFDGSTSLGSAQLDANGHGELDTAAWPSGGARLITATFTPEPGTGWAASTSEAQTYRVVDLMRMVPDIEVSEPVATVSDASLDWTIANIWFSNFSVGFEREVVGGAVSLESMHPGTTIEEKQRYYFRPFTFSNGTGARDAAGNRVMQFSGTARLSSGSGNRWDFADPRLHLNANGDGYVTAEFSGFYDIGVRQDYAPRRVTIATFTGAEVDMNADGRSESRIALSWDGQAGAAGTWAAHFDASFPNEFVALLNPAINLFFASSGVATDASKRPHDLRLSFTERESEGTNGPGGSGGNGSSPALGSGEATSPDGRGSGMPPLARSGSDLGRPNLVFGLGLLAAMSGLALLARRRSP